MQPSGEVGRFEVVDFPSPPADRHRSSTENRYETKVTQSYFRLSSIFLLIAFVATVLWYVNPSAEDRRSETKLIGTLEVRLTEARSATTETRLVQHSEHEIQGQVQDLTPYLAI